VPLYPWRGGEGWQKNLPSSRKHCPAKRKKGNKSGEKREKNSNRGGIASHSKCLLESPSRRSSAREKRKTIEVAGIHHRGSKEKAGKKGKGIFR